MLRFFFRLSGFYLLALLMPLSSVFGQTKIQFTLPQSASTSAGAYAPDGTLLRTLWRGTPYPAGTSTVTWDGKDDNGQTLPASSYEIRVLTHNIRYVWDGAIGNTSASQSGPTVFQGYLPIRDMASTDTAMYYVTGFNEGQSNVHRFRNNNTRRQYNIGRVDGFTAFALLATDGKLLYMANNEGGVYKGGQVSFVYARRLADNAEVRFPAGQEVRLNGNYVDQYYQGVIDLDQNSESLPTTGITVLSNAASGLAVQRNGQLLAVAHRRQNVIRLFDKTSGQLLRTISITAPGKLSMAPNGDLWAISGTTVVRYTNLATAPRIVTTITGFSNPLAIAADPSSDNLVLVADGGNSQQVKAYSQTGAELWRYGQAGGYPANGNEVRTDKLWFYHSSLGETTFLTILADHSFWVGDLANNRSLHFSASRAYQEQIMYQPHVYTASADANNPTRIFNGFLEFKIDYTKPLSESWTLVRNWQAGLSNQYVGFYQGLRQVTTLTNGRTYAFMRNLTGNYTEIVELAGNKLRPTGIRPNRTTDEEASLMPDGALHVAPFNPRLNAAVTWLLRPLTGFDASGNPQWGASSTLAGATAGRQDPVSRTGGFGDIKTPMTSSNVLISFDYSKNDGWHLGGIRLGGTKWLWKASPTGALDGKGSYDIGNGVQYGGNTVMTTGRHVLYGYHGEFWKNAQAGQFMHFYDDGLFVGQFGETTLNHSAAEGVLAASAGNGVSPFVTVANGETYLWVNDEGGHGPQRWHVVGASTVQELIGTGTLGNTIVLAAPIATFPQQVTPVPSNRQLSISWLPVPGARGYSVYYAPTPGGPYTTIATDARTAYTLTNLTNDTDYYVAVAAQLATGTGPTSAEVKATPYATTALVQRAGEQSSTPTELVVDPAAPGKGLPALQLQEPLRYGAEQLTLPQVGRQGYVLFNWGGANIDNANVRPPFAVKKGTGWRTDSYLKLQFNINGQVSKDASLYSNPTGQIAINVSDDAWHYLTVFCPARFADDRRFTVSLAPQNQPSASVRYTTNEQPGRNHVYQFRFRGNVTLTVDSQGGAVGTLQAVFLDNDPLASTLSSPTPAQTLAPTAQQLTSFTLVNADNSADIKNLTPGETLNLATLPTRNLAIRANTIPTVVGSVVLAMSGTQRKTVTENLPFYTLFGDNDNRYTPWTPAIGTYSLTATPYTTTNAGGTAGTPLTVEFHVVNQSPTLAPAATAVSALYRVRAGGPRLSTTLGTFEADAYFAPAPGNTASSDTPVRNTDNSALYQTERYGTDGRFRYAFSVPNGTYRVVLHFAEKVWSAPRQRLFDVTLEGKKVLDDYDIFQKVGKNVAVVEAFTTTVMDGVLAIEFSSLRSDGGVDQPTLCAIEILPVTIANRDVVINSNTFATTAPLPVASLSVYPNPTQDGQVTLTFPEPIQGDVWYTVFSATGSAVLGGKLQMTTPTTTALLDLARVAYGRPGVYSIWLQSKTWQGHVRVICQ